MGWKATEFAQVVDRMRAGDHKAIAEAISELVDRQTESVSPAPAVLAGELALRPVEAVGVTRPLGVAYQISLAHAALVFYTVVLDETAGLLAPAEYIIDLLISPTLGAIDTSSVGQAYLYGNQLLGLATVGLNNRTRQQLIGYVPAGHWVKLGNFGTGGGTGTLVTQQEWLIV